MHITSQSTNDDSNSAYSNHDWDNPDGYKNHLPDSRLAIANH